MAFPALLAAAAPIVGGIIDAFSGNAAAEKNAAAQKEFAQHGVSWKVEDAKRAGVHPLYALGAQTHSFAPSYVGTDFQSAGQDVSRAITATQDQAGRTAVGALALERAHLENDLLRAQILKTRASAAVGPAMPSVAANPWLVDGQGDSAAADPRIANLMFSGIPHRSGVMDVPLERTASDTAGREVGSIGDVGFARTKTGFAPVPSKDVAERIEDNLFSQLSWMIRNQLLPSYGFGERPPNTGGGPAGWIYNPLVGEYQPAYRHPRGYKTWRKH